MMNSENRLLDGLKDKFGRSSFGREDVKVIAKELGLSSPRWFLNDEKYRVSRGLYQIPELNNSQVVSSLPDTAIHNIVAAEHRENLVPDKDPLFVKHGPYDDLVKIIESRVFYPLFITGLSGNGKTFSIEQACAELKREMIRVNVTIETDEDDLLGGFRLVNDSTKWFDGPIIRAMKTGALVLLDEVDLGGSKLMCLQPILEGKGILLKKINQFVKPAPGFNVVATANTKGQGSETGKFVGTNILNEAFLERFPATFEQPYPDESTETKILKKVFGKHGSDKAESDDFTDKLIKWATGTRLSFAEDASSDLITTRRLVHIANTYAILGDRRKSIEVCIARFDETTKQSFIQLYEKFDPTVLPDKGAPKAEDLDVSKSNKINDITSILNGTTK